MKHAIFSEDDILLHRCHFAETAKIAETTNVAIQPLSFPRISPNRPSPLIQLISLCQKSRKTIIVPACASSALKKWSGTNSAQHPFGPFGYWFLTTF